jgi:hypothetical protein
MYIFQLHNENEWMKSADVDDDYDDDENKLKKTAIERKLMDE